MRRPLASSVYRAGRRPLSGKGVRKAPSGARRATCRRPVKSIDVGADNCPVSGRLVVAGEAGEHAMGPRGKAQRHPEYEFPPRVGLVPKAGGKPRPDLVSLVAPAGPRHAPSDKEDCTCQRSLRRESSVTRSRRA